MSVISCNEVWQSRKGSSSSSEGRTYTREFRLKTDTPTTDEAEVLIGGIVLGLPQVYEFHPTDRTTIVMNVSCSPHESNRLIWAATVEYKRFEGGMNGLPVVPGTPEDLPPRISFSKTQYSKEIKQAWWMNGRPPNEADDGPTVAQVAALIRKTPLVAVVNSSGEPFSPGIQQEEFCPLIVIERNEGSARFRPDVLEDYIDTVNLLRIRIASVDIRPYQGRIIDIAAREAYDANNNRYYNVQYQIEVNRKGQAMRVMDAGFQAQNPNGGAGYGGGTGPSGPNYGGVVPIKDSMGMQVKRPVLLDGQGIQIPVPPPPAQPVPVFIKFLTRWPMKWDTLNLPGSCWWS